MVLVELANWTLMIVGYPAVLVALYAFIHAAMQRPDAFTAVDKLTKGKWLGITGGAVVGLLIFNTPTSMIWIIGLVAALVYIVDVRPKVAAVQRGR